MAMARGSTADDGGLPAAPGATSEAYTDEAGVFAKRVTGPVLTGDGGEPDKVRPRFLSLQLPVELRQSRGPWRHLHGLVAHECKIAPNCNPRQD